MYKEVILKGGKMKYTKILVLFLAVILLGSLVLTACGGSNTNPTDNGTPTDQGTTDQGTTDQNNNGQTDQGTDKSAGEEDDILVVPGMESNVRLNAGDVVPDLKFKLHPVSAGSESSLYQIMEENNAKALVLDFWAVWCEPCKEELPYLEQLHRQYKDKGLVVLAATIDPFEDEVSIMETLDGTNDNKIKKSWKKLGEFELIDGQAITMNIPVDGDRAMSKALGVTSIPRTFLIDKDHKLAYQHTGFDEGKVNELIEKVKEVMGE